MTRLVLAAGTTETAAIDGVSAAGMDGDLLVHTPSADAEILEYGKPVRAPVTPVSPAGCPTPAVVTRAVREQLELPVTVVDAGLSKPTAAGTVTVGATPGRDIREDEPVPTAYGAWEAARQFGRALDDDLLLAETVPGGTTTALGVLTALGETDATGVSSSLAANPLDLKREVVEAGLDASDLDAGSCAGQPRRAVRRMGDPTAAVLGGLTVGALETETPVTLAGGTQLLAVAALARHADATGRLALATTSFIDADPNVDVSAAADAFNLDVTITDPSFDDSHVAFERYLAGEAKEGVGMGGALAVADAAGVPMSEVREGVVEVYERLLGGDADSTNQ